MRSPLRFLATARALAVSVLVLLAGTAPAAGAAAETPQAPAADLAELSLEELMNVEVYGASKFPQKLSEAPSYVSIVTSDEIRKYGYRTVADVLRSLPGFQVTYDRNFSYVGVRGFGRTGDWNSRILVQIDGHRMNETTYDSVYVGNESILDIDLVDRIEVIRGPNSSLYGDNGFFAVINIFTRTGKGIGGAEVSAGAGSHETYKGRATYGNRFANGSELVLSGTGLTSDGKEHIYFPEFDTPLTNNGVAEDLDYEKYLSAFGKYTFGDFKLEGAYVERKKGVPTASYGAIFNDPRYLTFDARLFGDLKYEHAFGRDVSLMARLYYDQYWYHADFPYDAGGPAAVLNRDSVRADWWGTELQLTARVFDRHRIVAGADYQNNTQAHFENHDIDPYFQYIDSNRRTEKWAVFVQDEFRMTQALILNAGVRYDHYETFGGTTNPRVALLYSPSDKTTFKALYGTAFRAPNQYELYFDSPSFGTKGNPSLKPEKITTYELVYEQYLGRRYRIIVAGYYNTIDDLISQVTDPADGLLVFRNFAQVAAAGFEAELAAIWENGAKTGVSYTFNEGKDLRTHQTLVNSPQHMVKANIILPVLRDRLFAGVDAQYVSSRKTVLATVADDFVLTNLTLFSPKVARGLELSASVYNLFDVKYGDPGGDDHLPLTVIGQNGRTFWVKATYTF